MQTLCIAGELVLTFFDSGANTHLVEGSLAEHAGFTVLGDHSVSIGVVGGGTIHSGYGQYSCTLGPDSSGRHHEIECQGLERISEEFPQFDLRPLHPEFRAAVPGARGQVLPSHIGGDRVRILIGVRSTELAPRLTHSLPNGLGIYSSALVDIFGSTTCFGGTHSVFTKGYANSGLSASHALVLFSQVARAYLRGPYTFVASSADGSGSKACALQCELDAEHRQPLDLDSCSPPSDPAASVGPPLGFPEEGSRDAGLMVKDKISAHSAVLTHSPMTRPAVAPLAVCPVR